MYNSCVVDESRFEAEGSWPMVLRSWRRVSSLYHRSASWRRVESGFEAELALEADWFAAGLWFFVVMAEKDGSVLDSSDEFGAGKDAWLND